MKAKNLVIGITAHVDAGKTTLSEGLLYKCGSIRKLGRVDHQDAFLDTDKLERDRGITIFSKQARFSMGEKQVVLVDTPGHVDFSAEMERTLQILDYAILVINGSDGVQSHTSTLWKLFKHYNIPVFIFVNKMDQVGADKEALLKGMQKDLSESCVEFNNQDRETFLEELSLCDEELLDEFLETGNINEENISNAIYMRRVFPCYFGSALKLEGIDEFIEGFDRYSVLPEYPDEFGAKVYKISRDNQGNRVTHMKLTGGILKVKQLLGEKEKIDQIRFYSGEKFEMTEVAEAGQVCSVTGLESTQPGQGLGKEEIINVPVLEPVFSYKMIIPDGCDPHQLLLKLKQVEEELPHLQIAWNSKAKEIQVSLMGEIELEILRTIIADRFQVNVDFGRGNIVYKETIIEPAIGVGHFEPLRHYAEAHLLLEPGERGSGMVFDLDCSVDDLNKNWQRLILQHLAEKKHVGVLTGSEITDMKISVIGGRAHAKHTEGGDFREATYRAVRHGLMKSESILLEPYYEFRLELPMEMSGRAISDLQRMGGKFEMPMIENDAAIITGTAPVVTMQNYQGEVISYTKGKGRLFCSLKGYDICHNQEEVIEQIGYRPEHDIYNPASSVFCFNGSGTMIDWKEVDRYKHAENAVKLAKDPEKAPKTDIKQSWEQGYAGEDELEAIFKRTYGESKREKERFIKKKVHTRQADTNVKYRTTLNLKKKDKFLLVDGYNIIFAWEELKELSKINLEAARTQLADILANYKGSKDGDVIIVFDAYKVKGNPGAVEKYNNIYIIYTKEAQTADQYIERVVHKMGESYDITVATSDNLEQMISWGDGATCITARQLKENVENSLQELREKFLNKQKKTPNRPFEELLK